MSTNNNNHIPNPAIHLNNSLNMDNISRAMVNSRVMEEYNMDSHKEDIMRRVRRWVINSSSRGCMDNLMDMEGTDNKDSKEDIIIKEVAKRDS